MTKWISSLSHLRVAFLGWVIGSLGCEPTPDYRIVVRDIPDSATVLLVGWKSDSDTVSRTTLAVPVSQLSADARHSFSIGLSLTDAPDAAGVVSIATVDKSGCMTSVVNAKDAQRSSGGSVTTVEVELDPHANAEVVPLNPAYTDPMKCPKMPGLGSLPGQAGLLPTKPVAINALRELNGTAGVFDGGQISLHGWGFDRGAVTVVISDDPSKCFLDLGMMVQTKYPQYLPQGITTLSFRYPALNLQSYAELDLQVALIKSMIMPMPVPPLLLNGLIKCIAVSALSFSYVGPDGSSTSFTEILPTM